MIGLPEITFLRSPVGQEALRHTTGLPPSTELHRAIALLRLRFSDPLAVSALEMIELRRRAGIKFARSAEMLFTREALEQSSSEVVSSYRARRLALAGQSVADLCCGIGGDSLALSEHAAVVAIDRDPVRLVCLEHNLEVYGRREACQIVQADVTTFTALSPNVFIDPARREGGARLRHAQDYSPPLSFVLDLAHRSRRLCAKLAPGADVPLPAGRWERELISEGRTCREMVLWSGDLVTCRRRATVLRRDAPGAFLFERHSLESDVENDPPAPVLARLPHPGEVFLEPDPAVIRAHLVGSLAAQLDLSLLDHSIAYLVGVRVPPTPFADSYRVLEAFPYHEKALRQWLASRKVGHLIVKKRGFPLSPEEVQSRMRLKGPGRATVVLARRGDRHIALIVERLEAGESPDR